MRTQLNHKGRVSLPLLTATLALAITFTLTACEEKAVQEAEAAETAIAAAKAKEAAAKEAIAKLKTAPPAAAQAQAKNTAPSNTTGEDFFFGIETGNGPEYPQFVVDEGGNSFTFHRKKQLKDIRLISIGMSEDGKLYEDNVYAYALDEETGFYTNIGFYEEGKRYGKNVFISVPNEVGSFFVMVSVSEGIPTRGIAFTDENGKRKYFYISMSGVDGSFSLNEFTPQRK